jgi:hypothetical protein
MTVTTTSSDSLSGVESVQLGGGKKKNGHKMTCGCPICVNMKHAKHGGSSCAIKTGGKKRKGKGNGHKPNCMCPICRNMKKTHGGDEPDSFVDLEKGTDANADADFKDLEMGVDNEVAAADSDYTDLDAAEKGEAGLNIKVGGTRRRKRRGSRKTKRSKKSTRKTRKGKRTNRRR